MNLGGWLMLIGSWTAISALSVLTLWRSLKSEPADLAAPLDIEADLEQQAQRKEAAED